MPMNMLPSVCNRVGMLGSEARVCMAYFGRLQNFLGTRRHEEPVGLSAVGSRALPANMLETLPSLSTGSMATSLLRHNEAYQVGADLANFRNEQEVEDSGQERSDAIRQPNMTHAGVNQSAAALNTVPFSELMQSLECSTTDLNEITFTDLSPDV